jgi:hypothetical protein
MLGALVARHALKRNSAHATDFDVRILNTEDFDCFRQREGELYLRGGEKRAWLNADLQSFTPLRFAPPQLMDYQGRALLIDPDVFAVGDVWELLSRDMQGRAILCRMRTGTKGRSGCHASSVMLLDCARLRHWDMAANFSEMFSFRRDYRDWVCLKLEDQRSIGFFEPCWNDFDHLDANTRLLHNTKRRTQPWKTGLPVDFRPRESFNWFPPRGWVGRLRRKVLGEYALLGRYKPHPDPNQERLFFGLLREALEQGDVSEAMLREEMRRRHLRRDAMRLLAATPPLAAAA